MPFEACLQGRVGVGSDLSPFASLVASAKLDPPTPAAVSSELDQLEKAIVRRRDGVDPTHVEPEIRSFFHDDTCREILVAKQYLFAPSRIGTRASRVVASAVCHILHGNRPYALSRRSHGIIPIPPKGEFVYKSLMSSLRAKVARLAIDDLPGTFVAGEGMQSDAGRLPLEDGSVDAIITSPPFLGTTEFLRQNRVRLWFSGMGYQEQRSVRGQFAEYQKDMAYYDGILREWSRVLRRSGRLVMHLGVVRHRDMALELTPYLECAGLSVRDVLYEPASHLESHGRTARGATHTHQFVVAEACG